jgi:flagellar biosynthesis/type III secretory pathway protein FliH
MEQRLYCECGEELKVCETEKWGSRAEPIWKIVLEKCSKCSDMSYNDGFEDGDNEGRDTAYTQGYEAGLELARKNYDEGFKDGLKQARYGGNL